ncbi:MAG: DJ-1/PfpI family protein, partial [Candidatus Woesearchaeota archaeon]
ASTAQQCNGKLGAIIMPDMLIAEITLENIYDAYILVGGPGTLSLLESAELKILLKNAYEQEKLMCAICMAPKILLTWGLLNTKATSWDGVAEDIKQAGIEHTGEKVCVDDSDSKHVVITARGPDATIEFAKAILENMF